MPQIESLHKQKNIPEYKMKNIRITNSMCTALESLKRLRQTLNKTNCKKTKAYDKQINGNFSYLALLDCKKNFKLMWIKYKKIIAKLHQVQKSQSFSYNTQPVTTQLQKNRTVWRILTNRWRWRGISFLLLSSFFISFDSICEIVRRWQRTRTTKFVTAFEV